MEIYKINESYPEGWIKIDLIISPNGKDLHIIGGDKLPGVGDMPYKGATLLDEYYKCKFHNNTDIKLGDKVKSNGLLSPTIYGKIVEIRMGYIFYLANPQTDFTSWTEHDPNWFTKPVYTVEKYLLEINLYLDNPNIPEECKKALTKAMTNYQKRYTSYMSCELEKLPDDYN